MANSKLLKEAIADAKAVKETALANAKLALEEASRQLKFKNPWPQISIIRPGGVATQETFNNTNKADVDLWVKSIIDTVTHNDNINISEISVGYTKKRIPI